MRFSDSGNLFGNSPSSTVSVGRKAVIIAGTKRGLENCFQTKRHTGKCVHAINCSSSEIHKSIFWGK